jgi:hypothetical protein
MIAKVGKPAPDFEAAAYVNGGFQNIKLSPEASEAESGSLTQFG